MAWFSTVFLLSIAFLGSLCFAAGKTNFRWCVKGADENKKCLKFKEALPEIASSVGVEIEPDCVDGKTADGCIKKIKDGMADLITLDGGEIYNAGKEGLVLVVAEINGGSSPKNYYAVAVAKKNNTGVNLGSLKDKKSCHTGYQKTSGWNVPVGYLLDSKKMERAACGVTGTAKSVSEFFSKSCVPGAPSQFSNLCSLCPPGCKKDSSNKYYGYHGAFKCMASGTGDVAFVKHLTTGEVVSEGGYGNMSDYVYLCKDGKRKEVTQDSHLQCNLAKVSSHAVMTKDVSNNNVYEKVLLRAAAVCKENTTVANCSGFLIFDSKKYVPGKKDLLFKDSTVNFYDVDDTYKKYLGDGYYKSVEGLTTCPKPTGAATLVSFSALLPLALSALVMTFV